MKMFFFSPISKLHIVLMHLKNYELDFRMFWSEPNNSQ